MADQIDAVDVAQQAHQAAFRRPDGTQADGTLDRPWPFILVLAAALRLITPTRKTVHLRTGNYVTEGPQVICFRDHVGKALLGERPEEPAEAVKAYDDRQFKLAQKDIVIEGHACDVWIHNNKPLLDQGRPALLWQWSPKAERPNEARALFFWKFRGLSFHGCVDNVLVQFGEHVEDTPWNTCEFDLRAGNDFMPVLPKPLAYKSRPSCGIKIFRALQSKIDIGSTCRFGDAVCLVSAEFCQITGSFSNSEERIHPETDEFTGRRQFPGTGLRLRSCQSNAFGAVNLEVCHDGIQFVGSTFANTFATICVTNCSPNGVTFATDRQVAGVNTVISLNRRPDGHHKAPVQPQPLLHGPADRLNILSTFVHG